MSDMPETAPDDSWMPDVSAAPVNRKAPARPKAKVTPLRPLDALADEIDNAPEAEDSSPTGPRPKNPDAAPPEPDRGPPAPPPGRPARPHGQIWDGCPVRPLGVNGATYFYLDTHSQMRPIAKHDAQSIMMLFGHRLPALCANFPQYDKDGIAKKGRFDQTSSAMAMIAACSERGLLNPDGAVRGVGAWSDDDGQLIYHMGDEVLIGAETAPPDSHQGKIYPAFPAIPHPAIAAKASTAAAEALETFAAWNWERPEIDPMICLGMVGIQMLGGALSWRPTFWNTGSRSTGKSTFQKLLKHMHGPGGLIQSTDTTKSGITSQIGQSSLPVAVDEFEPDPENPAKERAIIDLARVASSGGNWFRGSADQRGVSGNVYSTMFFSSILIPGTMGAADRSRLVVLSLKELAKDAAPLTIRAETWRNRGAVLKRLLIDRWPTWPQRLDLWREALAEARVTGRNNDNYATILAMADMALSEALPTADTLTGWASKVAAQVGAEIAEIGSDATDVLMHLLSQPFDPFRRGQRHSVATWLKAAGWRPGAGRRLFGSQDGQDALTEEQSGELETHSKRANQALASIGLRVIGNALQPELFVSTGKMQGLLDLFAKSEWRGGAWSQSLKRVPGAYTPRASRYLDGQQTKGTVVPFAAMPGLMALDGTEVSTPTAPTQSQPEANTWSPEDYA